MSNDRRRNFIKSDKHIEEDEEDCEDIDGIEDLI